MEVQKENHKISVTSVDISKYPFISKNLDIIKQ